MVERGSGNGRTKAQRWAGNVSYRRPPLQRRGLSIVISSIPAARRAGLFGTRAGHVQAVFRPSKKRSPT
eukprot:12918701-Prorocentrum_lima.AAC.1